MRYHLKKTAAVLIPLCLVLALCLPANAAPKKETITSLKLTVTCDPKPEAGQDTGNVTVTVSDERVEISEPAAYYDPEDSVWIRGEIPMIQLELSVREPEKYRFTSSTKVTPSGSGSQLKSKKTQDSGSSLLVQLKLKKVTGPLGEVDDYYWEGTEAEWEEVLDADRYEVRLYRGSSLVTTVTTGSNHYNFYPFMSKAGEYMFKVRGICTSDSKKGPWTDKSEECSIAENYVYTGNVPGSTGSGPSSGSGPSPSQAGWVQDQNGSDGTKGAMKTGWQNISGAYYYFNPVSDGTRGAMRTGYQNVDGRTYYLDPSSGILWRGRNTPNGRWADANGVIQ